MGTEVEIQCPWCFELVTIWLDPQSEGEMVRDCEVCCRPWALTVRYDGQRQAQVRVRRG